MNEMSQAGLAEKPVLIPIEAYVSEDYVRAENEKLWPKVWQIACREEEIPHVGDYVTYDILDESIIVVRTAAETIAAYYNVCQHRGRRLTKGCGHTSQFYCRFHGWSWNIEGENTFVLDREDWGEAFTCENVALKKVQVDSWGGWIWINMDPDAEPLAQYLEPAHRLLSPFELETMRYKWRKWLVMPCNWKTALEAFNESYHRDASHPQLTRWVDCKHWSKGSGRHGWHGVAHIEDQGTSGAGSVNAPKDTDPRLAMYELNDELMRTLNTTTTDTLLAVSARLIDELPEGSSAEVVAHHMMDSAVREDAARGVSWPQITPEQANEAGADWHVFPNSVILPGPTFALCYRARPNGYDPNSCIFEVYALERFPAGVAPKTEWVHEPELSEEKWGLILMQDFTNMPEVQKGMKSRGFMGPRPNPREEVAVTHFHRTLAGYMGTGAPIPLT